MSKRTAKKAGINLTAILCAAIIGIAGIAIVIIGAGSSWFTNPEIKTWFGLGKQPETEINEIIVPQELGCMVLSSRTVKGAPVALSGEKSAGNTCTLTAKLEPADAYYSSVTWTATEGGHIELTQDEADPLTVTVKMSGELFFTEQITVEVVSVKTLSATCNVDYLAYPDTVNVSIDPATQYLKCGGEKYTVAADFNYSTMAGTIHDFDCVITDWQLELTSETVSAISAELGKYPGWDYAWEGNGAELALGASPWEMFCDTSAVTKDDFNRAFFKVCNGRSDIATISVYCSLIYNGQEYCTRDGSIVIGFDSASYAIGLDGVNIGDIFFTD